MSELKAMCEAEGLKAVQTYIASGNVVFSSERSEAQIKAALEKRLRAYTGKTVSVFVRTAREMAEVLAANPFPEARPNRTYAIFLDGPPPGDTLEKIRHRKDEEVRLGRREIFVHYGEGMGQSKLRIPAGESGTARNFNTIAKLVEIAASK